MESLRFVLKNKRYANWKRQNLFWWIEWSWKIVNFFFSRIRENLKRYSKMLRDRPIPRLQEVAHFMHSVIKRNGCSHNRVRGATMEFFEYFLFGLYLLIFLIFFTILILIVTWIKIWSFTCELVISITIHYITVKYNTVQCSKVQYSTIKYSTVQYNKIHHVSFRIQQKFFWFDLTIWNFTRPKPEYDVITFFFFFFFWINSILQWIVNIDWTQIIAILW